ncbi:AraC family transcriptional regulator [Devosia rhizoryzae]|uniref:AraC family transcriptional regulator n=1 Tax=Devosia rhizoryzae TaxID=2774137 RepID=A0ABX7C3C3_9HYPH|nr:AraC family transcriptional regulator [Devosia rhizoryzae]QQR38708.1 AraC family transcriptional regulator [Devosia rhizoryzae]
MSAALLDAVSAFVASEGGGEGYFPMPMAGVHVLRSFHEVEANHALYRPSLCVVVQGGKQFLYGDLQLDYGTMQALVVSMDMPATGRIVAASADEPFIGVTIDFDPAVLRDVLEHLDTPPALPTGEAPAMFVEDISTALADTIARLVRLAETPQAIPVLYPAIQREIYFWLLTGPHGREICRLALPETHLTRIAKAIKMLREQYSKALPVELLASAAGMSNSSFHQHFKALTSMTPLQYQKQLRLLEARRLMMSDAFTVSDAAYRVGYESVSQFSREYSRAFGTAPKRDSTKLRAWSPEPMLA